ncbi:hypothetical protein BpHYR1_016393 [Brachionus plicatilis]|uniref:Uncharacterized protein n=1 Tax=Brachionus plicatilis TaxID=10195 RepID=A0A3M7SXD2_BRAPC|nr:hypothetical protein BpHYR1_016393 [Brachionus plicatilis]
MCHMSFSSEQSTRVIPELRPMASQKISVVTLVQKDKDSTISSTILPRNEISSRLARPSLTESDSDTSINGRTLDRSKKRRVRDSDDENDPDYSNRPRYKTKPQSKNKKTSKEMFQNSHLFESEESNHHILPAINGQESIKNEPCIDYESLNVGNGRSSSNSENNFSMDNDTCRSIAQKYRDLLSALVNYLDMHDFAQDLPNFSLDELNQMSINVFFSRFKDSVVDFTRTKMRKQNSRTKLSQFMIKFELLLTSNGFAISYSYFHPEKLGFKLLLKHRPPSEMLIFIREMNHPNIE